MRIDRQLWQECEKGERSSPFLRVYEWSPACLSLGYHQELPAEIADRAAAAGIDVVRRPTGGAAVLHSQEITYSLVSPLDDQFYGTRVQQIYDRVASALVEALGEFSVDCDRGGGGRPQGFACFSAAGGHEITVGGRKLVGSALRRGRRAFLQHGSLLTGPAHLGICELMGDSASRASLRARTIDLSAVDGGATLSAKDFAAALSKSLGQA